jgi:soluble lytic murein transglycosylase-like protein
MNMKLTLRDIIYIGLSVVFLSVTTFIYIRVDSNHKLVNHNAQVVNSNSEELKEGMRRIESGIPWSVSRQKTILFMQNEILTSPPKDSAVSSDMAYEIAKNNYVLATEMFGTIDPLFLLAIQWQESRFFKSVVIGKRKSTAYACGINQLMEGTARDMAASKGLEWSNSYLTDPLKNTRLAVIYIDKLQARGYSKEQILAVYNWSYKGSDYWINNRNALPDETKKFIPSIMNKYKEYQKKLMSYEVVKTK